MPILSGKRLGPFEILSAIGAGGMGEVYRAKDTRLNRIVAIKVLPAHLADSHELKERFEREARTIASLNHPHICTLYDIGHQDGTDFLVMEYLEGGTLAQRLVKGPLPLDQVLQFSIEIADALDKAHRKGVTHRDLKPGNIMLTKSGTKMLDFGLAKLKQDASPSAGPLSQLPTAAHAITAQGTILGTLQYMAPEQLEGKEVDARTDTFAFGAVVYEMVTGKKAFEGKSSASVVAKILETDPSPMSSLQPMTPPALDHLVRRCFAKEPDERWQTASDLCRELKWLAEGGAQTSMPVSATADRARMLRRRALVAGLACLIVAGVASLATWSLKPAPVAQPTPVSRLTITLPAGDQLAALDYPAVAISPDGTQLAYVAMRGGTRQIYLRALDSLEARPLAGTEGANTAFFSPDGRWLGFLAGGKLKKISVKGGAAVTLSEAANGHSLTWGSQGMIVFDTGAGPLEEISDAGGAEQQATQLGKGENFLLWPEFLPDGKAFLFTSPFISPGKIAVQTGPNQRRDLIQSVGRLIGPARYAPSGHLLYVQAGTLMAVPFDLRRLEVKGAAVPLVEGVAGSAQNTASQWSISATGSLVYVSGGTAATQSRLVWVDRNGNEKPSGAPPRGYGYPKISPDGRRVAEDVDGDIWVYDTVRDALTRLTFQSKSAGNAGNPIWTPDGKRIVFRTLTDKGSKLFWQPADGSGPAEELTSGARLDANSFSPDGKLLAFTDRGANTGADIWVLRLGDLSAGSEQGRKAQPFLQTPKNEVAARFSPDAHWLAYVSDESDDRNEIYVQPYPGLGGKWQISTDGGNEPVWNPNGRELFYRNGDKMMAVDVTTQPTFSVSNPKMLFEGGYRLTAIGGVRGVGHPYYDVSPDGQRFLMVKDIEAPAITQINVVLNWFEELKRRVPTGTK